MRAGFVLRKVGLGSGATKDYSTSFVPTAQLGSPVSLQTFQDFRDLTSHAIYTNYPRGITAGIQDGSKVGATSAYVSIINVRGWEDSSAPQACSQWFAGYGSAGIGVRVPKLDPNGSYYYQSVPFWTTDNTTKSSDGTLKAASPVIRIVKSFEENQRNDIDEEGFTWSGAGTVNSEAEGVLITRQNVGVYVIFGAASLATSGWKLLPPMDPVGMGELGIVEAEESEGGNITIRLYKSKYILSDGGEIVKTKGEPIDVPPNSWIDVRLDMPEDSIFNQKSLRIPQV